MMTDLAFDLIQSAAYENSWSDRALLSVVSTPVAVNPYTRLRRFAEDRCWEILSI